MNLRRVLTALAVLALFVGLASAQVVTPTPINCSVSAAAPSVRSQGATERPGDVIITCTSGPSPTAGNAADRSTVTIDFGGVPITTRTKNDAITDSGAGQNSTDALLLIDEPGSSGGPISVNGGYGQNAAIVVCTALQQRMAGGIQANCPAYAEQLSGYWVIDSSNLSTGGTSHAANAYQGVTPSASGGNTKLTFMNVPVVATGSGAVSRVYRLVNARLNVGSSTTITANVTVTPNSGSAYTLNVTNNAVAVATATSGLITSVTTTGGATLCIGTDLAPAAGKAKANLALLTFQEGFGTAFKTRVLPLADAVGAAEDGTTRLQVNATGTYATSYTTAGASTNITVTSAQSESGVVVQGLLLSGVNTSVAGLADSGTRFKAVFTGLSNNATYFVSQFNVADYFNEVLAPNKIGDANPTPYAIAIGMRASGENAIVSETVVSSATPLGATGVNANTLNGAAGVHVVALTVDPANHTAEMVWEVTNASTSVDTFNFALYAVYNNVTSAPPIGNNGAVALGFAPTNASGNSNSTSTNSFIPRFAPIAAAANVNVFVVIPCQTTLLFPFVSNTRSTATTHWDTGIAIVNTGADPWNSVSIPSPASATTTCNLTFYGPSAPPAMTTPPIAPGGNYAFTISDPLQTGATTVTNFAGYMFAVCNFQFAHAFVFVEDDTRSMAMGYLGLVVDNGSSIQRAAALTGERLSH